MAQYGKTRALGQHFLHDQKVIRSVVDTFWEKAQDLQCKSILEIGPGKGALTDSLLEKFTGNSNTLRSFTLCERDPSLAHQWKAKTERLSSVHLFEGDFLQLKTELWLTLPPLGVVSNLPYSSGTAIFVKLAEQHASIALMVLMFQAEVAKRLRATIGTKSWGSLSIWTQNFWEVSELCAVPPGAFSPPPDVNSEVVLCVPRKSPMIPTPDPKAWNELLKACFAHRRKMLRSGLPKSGPLRNALELAGVNDTKRAEALDWDEWKKLYLAYLGQLSAHPR